MKLKNLCILTLLGGCTLTIAPGCARSTTGQTMTGNGDTAQIVKKALQEKAFKIHVTQMYPQNRRARSLTTYYSLELRNDSVFSDLPYFGEAYTPQMPNDKGLVFEGPVMDLKITPERKEKTVISFDARNNGDTYTYNVTLWNNGVADIMVQAMRRQSISYHGKLEE